MNRTTALLARACLTFAAWATVIGATAAAGEPTLAEEEAFRAAVARVAASVVRIEPAGVSQAAIGAAAEAAAATGPSTGLVVDPAGLIVTTAFAVPDDASDAIVVLADGTRLAARPKGRDRGRGLVMLETKPIPGAVAVEAVPRAELAPGQWTIAVGRAWKAAEPSVAVGILSAVDRSWGRAVQTDASVSPMNYGGPLVDIAGRVIGILAPLPADTAGMKLGTELYDAGIGFAVPLEDVMRLWPRLAQGEDVRPGILGIGYRSRDEINGEPVIGSVRQGSPAATAGLAAGDRIVRVAGRDVARIADVRHQIAPRSAGDEIEIVIDREGRKEPLTARVTLVAELPPWRRGIIGVVPAATAEQATAVKLECVLPGGPAAKAGLTAGDAIAAVEAASGGGRVSTPSAAALAGALASFAPGDSVKLGVIGGRAREVVVKLAVPPADVPAAPPAGQAASGGGRAPTAAVIRLGGADVADPALAVVPEEGDQPVGVLFFFGLPRGRVPEADAAAWREAAARHRVAVVLPGSGDPRQWSRDDVAGVVGSLQALDARRTIDVARVAVVGRSAGGGFAWLVADRLGAAVRGIAVVDAPLPPRQTLEPSAPGQWRWILLGGTSDEGRRHLDADALRLEAAGSGVGRLANAADAALPPDLLCRWVFWLGML
jgi:serine protease Do